MPAAGKTARNGRRRWHAAERQADILAVALDLFAKSDFAGVTMRDIARSCAVNPSLIYHYYGGKKDLFRASIEHAVRQTIERYRSLRARRPLQGDPRAALDDWFDVNLALAAPLRKFAKVVIDYTFSPSKIDSIDRMIERFYADERALLAESLAEGVRRGLFRPLDPQELAAFVQTHLDGAFFGSMTRASADLEAGIERLRRVLWDRLGCKRAGTARRRRARLHNPYSAR